MALLDEGWSTEQAKALLDALMLREGIPDWKPQHLARFQRWCVAKGRDKNQIESQIEFVAEDLCDSHEAIGMALKLSRTVEEAKAAVEPYVNLLREESEWYRRPSRRA